MVHAQQKTHFSFPEGEISAARASARGPESERVRL